MAAPVLQATGALAILTANNLVVTLPAYVANDIIVLASVAHVPNTTTGTATMSLASPWTKNSPDNIVGSPIDVEYATWWARATSNSSLGTTVTITRPANWDTGNDTAWGGIAYVIRGAVSTGNPFDEFALTSPSALANPNLPAVTVNGIDRLVFIAMLKNDNTATPNAASGYTIGTETANTTGTDLALRTYTRTASANVAAVTPTGGVAPANVPAGSVYAEFAFIPEITVVSRTATGYGKSDLVDSYNNNNTYATTGVAALANISGASTEYGMSFTGNGQKVRSVVVALKRTGTLTGGATVRIWSHTGTFGSSSSSSTPVPGTLLATSGGFLVSGIATSITRYRIDFPVSDQITLTAGTNYYVTVNYTGGSTGNTLDVGYDRTGLTAAGNSAYFPFGGAWTNETTPTDMLFDVEAVTATGLTTKFHTATGSGTGTESATGNRVGITISRTADGSGQGTETATGVKVKITTARGIGHSAISAQPSSFSNSTVGTGTNFWIAQTFTGTGSVLDSIRINMNENGTVGNTVVFVDIYALTGTLSSGTPTGSVLATSGNVTVPTSAVGPPTFFSFTGANRITLSNGVNYAFIIHWVSGTNAYQVRLSDFDLVPGAYLHSSNSGGSWTIFGAARELVYGVYGADAVGVSTRYRTATGSGTGTDSATFFVTKFRTATGSGTGTESATGNRVGITISRTADGSGQGTETATGVKVKFRRAITDGGHGNSVSAFNGKGDESWVSTNFGGTVGVSFEWEGQSFKGNGKKLASVKFTLTRTNVLLTTGSLYAQLYAHTGTYGSTGRATGTPLAVSEPVAVSTLPTGTPTVHNTIFVFNDANKYLLTDGTPYVIGVYCDTATSPYFITIYIPQVSLLGFSSYFAGNRVFRGAASTVFSANSGSDLVFFVEGVSATGSVIKVRTATGSGTGTDSTSGENAEIGINWSVWGSRVLL